MKSQKVFVSVGMRGRDAEQIAEDIVRVKKTLRKEGVDFIFVDNMIEIPYEANRLYGLGEAIKTIGDCDAVAFCFEWQEYSGCIIEHLVAEQYGLDIYEQDMDGDWCFVSARPLANRYKVTNNVDDFDVFMNPPMEENNG